MPATSIYESIASGSGNGQSLDAFVNQSKAGGAQADLTIPILPYVASLGPGGSDLGSYPVSVYGPQQYTDPYHPNFGNGVTSGGQNITDTNPLYNYVANSPAFEQAWIQHLLSTFGSSSQGGVPYFTLGNEPGLWNSTHRDIHPDGETNSQLLNDFISYGSMIKSLDPNAQILGPEEWGWTNYFVDGADAAAGNYGRHLQRVERRAVAAPAACPVPGPAWNAAAGLLHAPLLSAGKRQRRQQRRRVSANVDQATALLRNQVTRSLWDPNYVDPELDRQHRHQWRQGGPDPHDAELGEHLLPRHQDRRHGVQLGRRGRHERGHHPGRHLGIFGQQGLDLATRWTTPAAGTPTYLAMKLWRNYDGNDCRLWQHQRQRHGRQSRPDRRLRRSAVLRRRPDGRGHQQEPVRSQQPVGHDPGHGQPGRLRQQRRGPGVAARRRQPGRSDQGRHHAPEPTSPSAATASRSTCRWKA